MSDLPSILLLGAGGFIGANLTERLLAEGRHQLTAVDIDAEKLEGQLGHAHLAFHRQDIRERDGSLEALVEGHDLVVDLVAMANPSLYLTNPLDVFHLNFTENLRIVEYCVKHGKRLVQFSTCEVYGRTVAGVLGEDPAERPCPFQEDTTPLIMGPVRNHRWIYACAKQLLERVLHAYGLEDRLDYTIVRPFNFIGPRIDYLPSEKAGNPRVFSHFMNALLYGTPMKLVDGGRSYRAYTHIDDAVEGIVRILDRPEACHREIFNLGTPENETSIRRLALLMKELFDEHFRKPGDPEPEIVEVSGEEFYGPGYEDCDRRIPDVAKARALLGWESRHDLRSVVLETMRYFVDRHRAG
jgi:UDP-apiose/xylose synthase